MRIAMLSVHTCPLAVLGGKQTGGMNVYVRELARELGRQGVGVDVFTRSQDEHEPHLKHDLGYGNRVFHIPAGPERPLARKEHFIHLPEFVGGVRLASALLDTHYDLIHSHYWLSGVVAHELKRFWGVPIVHMSHTLGVMKNRVALTPEERDTDLRMTMERKIHGWADRIVAATPAEQAQLQWLMRVDTRKVAIIPPGVDVARFRPMDKAAARTRIGVPLNTPLLLFVGRPEPLKGGDTLLRAVKLLTECGALPPNAQLAIIGGDLNGSPTDEMERLQTLRNDLGLHDVVAFLGKRGQDTLPYYYNAADVVVMPSHYESFGMVALEAMACGTPVVASEVGGLAFLVQHNETGYLVPDQDPLALQNRLCELLTNPLVAERMSRKAAEHAAQYSWAVIAGRMIDLYEAVLQAQTSPRPELEVQP